MTTKRHEDHPVDIDPDRSSAAGVLSNMPIRGRLIVGFGLICALLVAIVSTTIFEIGKIDKGVSRINDLRVPTAFASGGLVRDIDGSLASLSEVVDFFTERFPLSGGG